MGRGGGVPLPSPPSLTQALSTAGHTGVTGDAGQEQGDPTVSPSPPPAPPPTLRESPYANRALVALDHLAEGLLAPSFWAVNHLLDLRPTTAEWRRRRRWWERCQCCARLALAGLAFATVLLLSLPLAVLGLVLWLPVQAARRPFAYQYRAGTAPAEPWDLCQRRTFTFLSANVCLLPSGLAKFSNLGETPRRATAIARRLATTPPRPAGGLAGQQHGGANSYGTALCTTAVPEEVTEPVSTVVPVEVTEPVPAEGTELVPAETTELVPAGATELVPAVLSESFPADVDFVCLQEVFDAAATATLCQGLAGTFPHILSQVGTRGVPGGHLKLFNSGLFLASRYQPLAVTFHPFPNGAREDALATKGLLAVQVLLGWAKGQRIVGYIGCTHLQAPTADGAIRAVQMTLALQWLQEFRETREQRGDVVAFDVLAGDLNFDNCSPGDKLNQRHQLFEVYRDPCRQAPGQDVPWAIGTLLNYLRIHEEPVSTPRRMRRTLSRLAGRQQYLAGPILSDGRVAPVPPSPWHGRRLDYLLYRQHRGAQPLRTDVAGVSVVTQLATLSDHLPVTLRLEVTPAPPPLPPGTTAGTGTSRGSRRGRRGVPAPCEDVGTAPEATACWQHRCVPGCHWAGGGHRGMATVPGGAHHCSPCVPWGNSGPVVLRQRPCSGPAVAWLRCGSGPEVAWHWPGGGPAVARQDWHRPRFYQPE
ncbi:sphingomyelin phosphodiesterase 5-like [Podargus strigoides]